MGLGAAASSYSNERWALPFLPGGPARCTGFSAALVFFLLSLLADFCRTTPTPTNGLPQYAVPAGVSNSNPTTEQLETFREGLRASRARWPNQKEVVSRSRTLA